MNSYESAILSLQDINAEYGHIWKLPPFEHCLMFAITEIGECVDAKMRTLPEYFRNRDLNENFAQQYYEEYCDVIMMLMKSLMSVNYPFDFEAQNFFRNKDSLQMLYSVNEIIAHFLRKSRNEINFSGIENMIVDMIGVIENEKYEEFVGETIVAKVQKTRNKIADKLAKEEMTNEN